MHATQDVRTGPHHVPLHGTDLELPRIPKQLGEDSPVVAVRYELTEVDAGREHRRILAHGSDQPTVARATQTCWERSGRGPRYSAAE